MNWRSVSLAAALAAIVIGYGAFVNNDSAPSQNHEMPEQPGYYLKDAVILRTREDGSPGIELIAKDIQQLVNSSSRGEAITMEGVRVNYYGEKDWKWELTSEAGEVPPNSRVVYLEGNVTLKPLDNGASNTTFVRTDELAIDVEKHLAYSTRSPVNMRYGSHAMTVKSLRADLNTQRLRLESVNGRFDPQPDPGKTRTARPR